MKFYQYEVRSLDLQEQVATFWVDEDGIVDADNLPSKKDLAKLLTLILKKELTAVQTGEVIDE